MSAPNDAPKTIDQLREHLRFDGDRSFFTWTVARAKRPRTRNARVRLWGRSGPRSELDGEVTWEDGQATARWRRDDVEYWLQERGHECGVASLTRAG
jgi:hypothetical protein